MDPRIHACGVKVCLQGWQNMMSKARWLIRTLLGQWLGSLPFWYTAHGGCILFGRESVARTGDARVNASEQNITDIRAAGQHLRSACARSDCVSMSYALPIFVFTARDESGVSVRSFYLGRTAVFLPDPGGPATMATKLCKRHV